MGQGELVANTDEQLEQLFASLMQMVEANSQSSLTVAENLAATSDVFSRELRRFRAFEALLYLFFARYYVDKGDPIGAATWDRDFLADQRRKYAQDEDGAQDIIKLYDPIFTYIKAGLEAKQVKASGEEDDTVM